MTFIVKRYNFNVPTHKTNISHQYKLSHKGGECPKQCDTCVAYKQSCNGCVPFKCMDRKCKGEFCSKCAVMCYRAKERVKEALDFIGGLEVDPKQTKDSPIDFGQMYIPAINKRIGNKIQTNIISIPFYAIFNFEFEKPFCEDIHDYFRLDKKTKVIINFYMKDDKICTLFEYMVGLKFMRIIKSYKGVSYWHTPCFSVFDLSNSMDQVLNWKRQWWIGDVMREAGLKVIQECLYTFSKAENIIATADSCLELIEKKGIKTIGQCSQLDCEDEFTILDIDFHRRLPYDVSVLHTGLSRKGFEPYRQAHENSFFCNYSLQYRRK